MIEWTNADQALVLSKGGLPFATIAFQAGPVKEAGVNGCQVEDLLRISRDRLIHLNARMKSLWNMEALHHISMALNALDRRTEDRERRGVEGTERP